jgi:hypothetical protein
MHGCCHIIKDREGLRFSRGKNITTWFPRTYLYSTIYIKQVSNADHYFGLPDYIPAVNCMELVKTKWRYCECFEVFGVVLCGFLSFLTEIDELTWRRIA